MLSYVVPVAMPLAVVYGCMVGALYLGQRSLLYLPDRSAAQPAAFGVAEWHEVQVETADGLTITNWYHPASDGKPTIAYFHGNGGHVGYGAAKMLEYAGRGYGVLLTDYRGYGGNPGKPYEAGLYMDARASLGFLEEQGIGDGELVLYGESLGSGVAVQMAAEGFGAATVLEAPFSSISDVAAHHYPWVPARWLVRDRFDSVSKMPAVKAPLLVVHGEQDQTVPDRFGRRLFEAAAHPKELHLFPEADHTNLYDHGADERIRMFIERYVTGPEGVLNPAPVTVQVD